MLSFVLVAAAGLGGQEEWVRAEGGRGDRIKSKVSRRSATWIGLAKSRFGMGSVSRERLKAAASRTRKG